MPSSNLNKEYNFSLKKFILAFKKGYSKLYRQSQRKNFTISKKYYRTGYDACIDDFLKKSIFREKSIHIEKLQNFMG